MVRAKRSKNGGFGWLYCKSLETAIIILLSLSLVYSHCAGAPLANSPSLSHIHTHTHTQMYTRANIPDYSDWQNIVTHTLSNAHRKKMPANICTHLKREKKKEEEEEGYIFSSTASQRRWSQILSLLESLKKVDNCKTMYAVVYPSIVILQFTPFAQEIPSFHVLLFYCLINHNCIIFTEGSTLINLHHLM